MSDKGKLIYVGVDWGKPGGDKNVMCSVRRKTCSGCSGRKTKFILVVTPSGTSFSFDDSKKCPECDGRGFIDTFNLKEVC